MKGDRKRPGDIAALSRLLESHGADRTRWPAPERLRFAGLLQNDPHARRLLAEAGALDRLLDLAPRVASDREAALTDRIMVSAAGCPQVAAAVVPRASAYGAAPAPSAEIASISPARLAGVKGGNAARAIVCMSRRMVRSNWPAAGLLAASLFIGIATGGSGYLVPALQGLPGVSQSDADTESLHLALGAEGGMAADEDTL